jgi:hypothetical protein
MMPKLTTGLIGLTAWAMVWSVAGSGWTQTIGDEAEL